MAGANSRELGPAQLDVLVGLSTLGTWTESHGVFWHTRAKTTRTLTTLQRRDLVTYSVVDSDKVWRPTDRGLVLVAARAAEREMRRAAAGRLCAAIGTDWLDLEEYSSPAAFAAALQDDPERVVSFHVKASVLLHWVLAGREKA